MASTYMNSRFHLQPWQHVILAHLQSRSESEMQI